MRSVHFWLFENSSFLTAMFAFTFLASDITDTLWKYRKGVKYAEKVSSLIYSFAPEGATQGLQPCARHDSKADDCFSRLMCDSPGIELNYVCDQSKGIFPSYPEQPNNTVPHIISLFNLCFAVCGVLITAVHFFLEPLPFWLISILPENAHASA